MALALNPVMLGWLLWLHLTTSQLGPNLYVGSNKVANGRYVPLESGRGSWRFEREDAHRLAEQALGRTLSDREVSRYWVGKTIEFVRAYPGRELVLLLNKLCLALNRTEVGDTDSQYLFAEYSRPLKLGQTILHFGVLLPVAGLCLLSWNRDRRDLLPLVLTSATLLGGLVVFYVFARYRYPLVHPLLLAALGLGNLWMAFKEGRRHEVALGCSLLVGLGTLANWPLLSPRVVLAESRYNLGVALADAGRDNEAAASYQAAIAAHDDFPSAHNNLGSLLAARGDLEGARQQFATALQQEPDHAWASLNLGLVLVRQGKLEGLEATCHPTGGNASTWHRNAQVTAAAPRFGAWRGKLKRPCRDPEATVNRADMLPCTSGAGK